MRGPAKRFLISQKPWLEIFNCVLLPKIAGVQGIGERRGSDPNVSSLKCNACFVLCFAVKSLKSTQPQSVKMSIIMRR